MLEIDNPDDIEASIKLIPDQIRAARIFGPRSFLNSSDATPLNYTIAKAKSSKRSRGLPLLGSPLSRRAESDHTPRRKLYPRRRALRFRPLCARYSATFSAWPAMASASVAYRAMSISSPAPNTMVSKIWTGPHQA